MLLWPQADQLVNNAFGRYDRRMVGLQAYQKAIGDLKNKSFKIKSILAGSIAVERKGAGLYYSYIHTLLMKFHSFIFIFHIKEWKKNIRERIAIWFQ